MLYILLVTLLLSATGVDCRLQDLNDSIAINGTEFRGMMNDTIYGRLDYWYVNMTRDMVEPKMIQSENDTQNSWLKNHSKSVSDLQKNKTNFNNYVDTVNSGYTAKMYIWKGDFHSNLSSVVPSTLETEIDFVL